MLALIGFALMIVLMFVLIKEKMAPPLAFILLPIIAAVLAGFGVADISEFIKTGMKTMMNTAILFIFSISYFTLMSDAGLFDPIINFLIKRTGKSITTVLIAVLLTTFVAHLDGSGATTFLIVVPAFLPICKKMGIRPQALLAAMCGGYGVMNLVPWGGPTMRAASVANIEVGDLYSFMIPGVVCLALFAFVIVFIVSRIEKKNGAGSEAMIAAEEAAEQTEKKQVKKGIYYAPDPGDAGVIIYGYSTSTVLDLHDCICHCIDRELPKCKTAEQKDQRVWNQCHGNDCDSVCSRCVYGCDQGFRYG